MTKRKRFWSQILLFGAILLFAPIIIAVTLSFAPHFGNKAGAKLGGELSQASKKPMDSNVQFPDIKAAYEIDAKKVSLLGDGKSLPEIEQAIKDLKATWSTKPGPYYSLLMSGACGTLNSVDLNNHRQYQVAYESAREILEQPDKLPQESAQRLDVEVKLVLCLNRDLGDPSWTVTPDWKARRRFNAERFLSVWQRIQTETDRSFNFEDKPALNVSPPRDTGLPAGVDPAAIKDATKRAQYEAAIEANRKKAETYRLQYNLQATTKSFLAHLKGYLVAAYTKAPADIEELQTLLSQYHVESAVKADIIKELSKDNSR